MVPTDSRERLTIIAIGILILIAPAVILVITLEILILLGDLELSQITPVEFLELYIVDLIVFIGLAYAIYRLILWLIEHQLPDTQDTRTLSESIDDESGEPEDR